ncbi:MAG: glycoside hydrolase, partial [Thermoplasmata archaeon]|nr:glycoside hydrolase [Thermoplasmata archaeon]
MAGRAATGRTRRTGFWAIVTLIAGLLLSAVPVVAGAPAAASTIASSHAAVFAAPTIVHAVRSSTPHPGLGVVNATIGPTYSSTRLASNPKAPCYWLNYSFANYQYCYPQTQNPSVVTLANGDIGVGYSVYTTVGPMCNATSLTTNLSSWTSTSIGWARSTTNGSSWGAPRILGTSTCRWPSSSEPTFAAASSGAVYGAFVLSNQTLNFTQLHQQPMFPMDWNNASGDALGFVASANNGSTWSGVSIIPNVTAAVRPQIAIFGQDIYVVYVYTLNSTAIYPGGYYSSNFAAPAVEFIHSSNGGASWSNPTILPGLNASMGFWSSSPSIAVNATGTIAVAYSTNRTCVQYCYSTISSRYGDQVVVVTSNTNGTTWTGPTAVEPNVTSELTNAMNYYDQYSYYHYYYYPWAWLPQTSIAFTSSGTGIYVAYDGGYVKSLSYPYYNWYYSGIFASYSSDGGGTWTNSSVNAPLATNSYDQMYSPAVAVSGNTPYIAYVWLNNSYCYTLPCAPFYHGFSSWVATSSNARTWGSSYSDLASMPSTYYAQTSWQGWESSVTISASGTPVTGTTLPGAYTFTNVGFNGSASVYKETYYGNVSIGYPFAGNRTYAVFREHNLTVGASWGVVVDGYPLTSNATLLNVTNVPVSVGTLLSVIAQGGGYRTIETSALSLPSYYTFTGPTRADVNYSTDYGVGLSIEPLSVPSASIQTHYGTQYYDMNVCTTCIPFISPALPWYFPANVTITFTTYGTPPITYWNGTGPSSYTGGGIYLNLTLTNPVNETAWVGSYGIYTESFKSVGLPSTSVYSFAFNGANY